MTIVLGALLSAHSSATEAQLYMCAGHGTQPKPTHNSLLSVSFLRPSETLAYFTHNVYPPALTQQGLFDFVLEAPKHTRIHPIPTRSAGTFFLHNATMADRRLGDCAYGLANILRHQEAA